MTSQTRRQHENKGARFGRAIALGGAFLAGALVFSTGPALAAAPPVFSNVPAALPGNVPSIGFESNSVSEFGDLIQLSSGTDRARANLPFTVVMSSWACESGGAIDNTNPPTNGYCTTTPSHTFSVPMTLNLYAVDHSAATPKTGALLLTATQTFEIPYRPSFDATNCTAKLQYGAYYYGWYDAAAKTCYSGFANLVTFVLPSGADLPDELIWGVAYNTQDHGYNPTGVGGPINSLNVGAQTFKSEPSYGTDVEPASAFVNSTWDAMYSDPAAGIGTFRDTGGWADNAPLVCIGVACLPSAPVTPAPTVTLEPTEAVGGATAVASTPQQATPPPTSTTGSSGGTASQELALFLCLAFGAISLTAVYAQRRTIRR